MSASAPAVNQVTLVGNLTADPVTKASEASNAAGLYMEQARHVLSR